jgi:glycerol-3-phosphate acyltransferase PlsY
MATWWLWLAGAYLVGAVPFAWLLARAHGIDIRQVGSGNIGATNVGRALGRGWGLLCFALDVGKGFGPAMGVGLAMGWAGRLDLSAGEAGRWLAVAAAAVIGHMFPVYLGFRGGKGVATGFGAVLGVWPLLTAPGLAALLTWGVTVQLSRYVSLSSIVAAASLPIYTLAFGLIAGAGWGALGPMLVVTAALAVLVIGRHRSNLRRLLAGTEARLGERKADEPFPSTRDG